MNSRYHVLYVDDEECLLEIGKRFLEKKRELSVDTLASATLALASLSKTSYDCIVSDYQMPEMDGITFLKAVRAQWGQLPFILFTGRGREEVVIEALNSGADFYLQKGGDPVAQFAELEYKIKLSVERRRTLDELSESRQRMIDIIDHLPDATVAIDLNGTVIAWNRAIEEMTGVPSEQILGTGNHSYAIPFYGTRRPILLDLVLKDDKEIERNYPNIIRKDNKLVSDVFIPLLYGGKGAYLWFIASPLYDTHGNIIGAIESLRDITDRKKTEKALRESEEKYRILTEKTNDIIYSLDLQGRITHISPQIIRYGYSPEDVLFRNFSDLIVEEDLEHVSADFERTISTGEPTTTVFRTRDTAGNAFWLEDNGAAKFDESGAVIGISGILRDITERKNAEDELKITYEHLAATEEELRQQYEEQQEIGESLRQSEATYRTILDNTGSATIIIEEDQMISFLNPEFERITGYLKEEIEGKRSWTSIVVPEDAGQMSRYHHLRRTDPSKAPRNYEFRFITKSGEIRSAYLTIGLIPGTKKTVASFVDITDNKRTEEALKASEKNYRTILENIQDVFYRSDQGGNLIMVSPSGMQLLGYDSVDEILGKNIAETFYADPSQRDTLLKTLEKDGFIANFEVTLNRRDGTAISVETSSHKFYDESGNFLGIEGIFRDISERKRVEEAFRRSETTYRTIFDNTGTATVLIDENTVISLVNTEFIRLSGYQREEIEGIKSWTDFVVREDLDNMLVQHRLRRERKEAALRHYEFKFIRKNGEIRNIYLTIDVIPDTKRSVASLADITERKTVEIALRESESRLNSIFNSSPALQFVIDKNHKVISWNRALEEFSGIQAETIVGTDNHWKAFYSEQRPCLADFLLDEEVEKLPEWYEKRINKSRLIDGAYEATDFFTTKSTSGNWLYFTAAPIRDTEGLIMGAVETLVDVTGLKQAEEKVMEAQQRLADIINFIPDAIFAIDRDGKVIVWNKAIEEMTGVKAEEMLGKGEYEYSIPFYGERRAILIDLIFASDEDIQKRYHGIVHKTGNLLIAETTIPDFRGKKAFLWGKASPLYDNLGNVAGSIESIRDVTERNQAEQALMESEVRLNSIINGTPILQFVIDKNHRVISWNKAIEEYSGVKTADVLNTTDQWKAFYSEPRPCLADLLVDEAIDKLPEWYDGKFCISRLVEGAYEATDFYPRMGISGKWLFFTAAPIRDAMGTIIGAVETLEDITERRLAEDALNQAFRKLNLLSSITRHDVLNQLTALYSYLELTKMDTTDAGLQNYITKAEAIVETINHQIEFTRDYQELGIKSPQWQAVNRTITQVISTINPGTIAISVHLKNVEIFADPLLERVFFNLIENAIRYGEKITRITFSSRESDPDLYLIIEDDGIGIPEKEKENIFTRAYFKHSGFGLFLSREILTITGLTIRETGEFGKGARFEIRVPKGSYRFFSP